MSQNITLWFGVFLSSVVAISLIYWIISITNAFYLARFYAFLLRRMIYPLFWTNPHWSRTTRFQTFLLGSYFAINGFCMGIGIHTTSDLISRSGIMASVNLIPLFFGGRTSMFSRILGLSLHSYYLWHNWIGRVVVIQGLLHLSLLFRAQSPKILLSSHIAGTISASALALLFLTSLWFVRKVIYEICLKIHLALAIVIAVALLKHLIPFGFHRAALPIAAILLWLINAGLRYSRMIYFNLGGSPDGGVAAITPFYNIEKSSVTAIKIHATLRRGIRVRPGQYYYLTVGDMGLRRRWESHPFVVSWWDDSINARSLDFLLEPQHGLTADLVTKNALRGITLDGPYGKDLCLQDYETVIIVARGIGIAGVLSYIRHMIYRRSSNDKDLEEYRRGLMTRKIDLYWDMEDNNQQDWLEEWILALKERDAEKLILTVTIFYPSKRSKPPPILQDEHWRFLYQKRALPIISDLILKRIARSPGKTKVVVCGTADFSNCVRGFVLEAMATYSNVEFAEVEYQPQGVRKGYPGVRIVNKAQPDQEIEMGVIEEMQRRKRLLVKAKPTRLARKAFTAELATLEEEEQSTISSTSQGRVISREFV